MPELLFCSNNGYYIFGAPALQHGVLKKLIADFTDFQYWISRIRAVWTF